MRLDSFAKDLVTGSYDLLILNALERRPVYGYEVVRRVAHRSKHTILWHRSTVYRVLHHLERRGLVTSQWKRAGRQRERRYYRLTARGRATWRRQRAQWQAFSTFVNALLGLSPDDGDNRKDRQCKRATFPAGMSCVWKVHKPVRKRYKFG